MERHGPSAVAREFWNPNCADKLMRGRAISNWVNEPATKASALLAGIPLRRCSVCPDGCRHYKPQINYLYLVHRVDLRRTDASLVLSSMHVIRIGFSAIKPQRILASG